MCEWSPRPTLPASASASGTLAWSSYLGGNGLDYGTAVATGPGRVIVAGQTSSTNFPSTGGGFMTANPLVANIGFISRIADTAPNGTSCGSGNECTSGFCIDGVCCNTTCGGACDACNLAGHVGVCTVNAPGTQGNPSCAPNSCDGINTSCPNSIPTLSEWGMIAMAALLSGAMLVGMRQQRSGSA